jgi:hypothetical protein
MSLWTPSGEHPVDDRDRGGAPSGHEPAPAAGRSGGAEPGEPGGSGGPGGPEGPGGTAESEAALDQIRRELAATPADVVISNHCYGLFELAAVYLSQDPPLLPRAQMAIDALGFVVEGLGNRLGESHGPLREALAQIRLAYVQVGAAQGAAGNDGNGGNGGNGADPTSGG